MTEQDIIQNAETYAKKHYDIPFEDDSSMNVIVSEESYIAGAHSRDEEIEGLKDKLSKQALLLEERDLIKFANLNAQLETENVCMKNQIEKLFEQLKMNTEVIQKLRNPWISVKERLPEKKR